MSFACIAPESPIAEHQLVAHVAIDAQHFVAIGQRGHRGTVEHHSAGVASAQIDQLQVGDAGCAVTECEVKAVATHLQGVKPGATIYGSIGCFGQQAHIGNVLVVVAVAVRHIPNEGVIALTCQQGVLLNATGQGVVAQTA